jgi:ribosomal protein L11 methyltransferase
VDYLRISIDIHPFEEWIRDLIIARLAESGFESFQESESGFDAYTDIKIFDEDELIKILKEFGRDFTYTVKKELIQGENWNREWEENYFKPLLIGGECLVRGPSHSGYPAARFDIIIVPNMAFGTGTHETTAMMIEALLKENLRDKSVADLGCGTGILGILAAMKGAKSIISVDIDERAVNSTINNAKINQINNIDARTGDISVVKNEKFDIILANIYKNILIENFPVFAEILNNKGKLLISGFITQDAPRIKPEAEKAGLKEINSITKNQWEVMVYSKI